MAMTDDALRKLDQFGRSLTLLPWFTSVGRAVTVEDEALAKRYLTAFGQRALPVRRVRFWLEAKRALDLAVSDNALDRAEAAEAARLLTLAHKRYGADLVGAIRRDIDQNARDLAHGAAAGAATRAGISEPGLLRAASTAAVSAIGLASAAIAAGESSHPFLEKLTWWQSGRWPLGSIDGAFQVF